MPEYNELQHKALHGFTLSRKGNVLSLNMIKGTLSTSHQSAKRSSHFTTKRSHKASGLLTGGPVRQQEKEKRENI